MTLEERVLAELDEEEGTELFNLVMCTGLKRPQISAALQRLRWKGLVKDPARWRETSLWWSTPGPETSGESSRTGTVRPDVAHTEP